METLVASGVAYGLLAMLGWGVGDLTAALLSRRVESVRALTWITLVSLGLVAALVVLVSAPLTFVGSALPLVVVAGLLNGAGGMSFLVGLRVGQVSLVSPIASGYAIVLLLAAVIVLGERLAPSQAVAVAMVVGGSLLASTDVRALAHRDRSALSDPGLPYAFGAMLGWGLGYFLLAVVARETGWATTTLLSSAALLVFLLAVGRFTRRTLAAPSRGRPQAFTLLTAGCFSVANVAYTVGVERHPAALVAPLGAAFPVVTLLLARWLLGERLARWQALGVGLVVAGVVLVSL